MNGGAKKISSEFKILEDGPKLDETEYEIKIDKINKNKVENFLIKNLVIHFQLVFCDQNQIF